MAVYFLGAEGGLGLVARLVRSVVVVLASVVKVE